VPKVFNPTCRPGPQLLYIVLGQAVIEEVSVVAELDRTETVHQIAQRKSWPMHGAEPLQVAQGVSAADVRGMHIDEVTVHCTVVQRADLHTDGVVERKNRADVQQSRRADRFLQEIDSAGGR
jgi:hypothetical protein